MLESCESLLKEVTQTRPVKVDVLSQDIMYKELLEQLSEIIAKKNLAEPPQEPCSSGTPVPLYIPTVNGFSVINFYTGLNLTVGDFADLVSTTLTVPREKFRLLRNGKDLTVEPFRRLAEYATTAHTDIGRINMELRMGGGAVKKIGLKSKADKGRNKQREEEDGDSNENSDGDDEKQVKSKVGVISKLVKECEKLLAEVEREPCFPLDDHLKAMVNMARDDLKLVVEGDGEDKLMELLSNIPERKLQELSSTHVTSLRNMERISKAVGGVIFEQEIKILKSKIEAARQMDKILANITQVLYAAKFCTTHGRLDHGGFERMLTKLVGTIARSNVTGQPPQPSTLPQTRFGGLLGNLWAL